MTETMVEGFIPPFESRPLWALSYVWYNNTIIHWRNMFFFRRETFIPLTYKQNYVRYINVSPRNVASLWLLYLYFYSKCSDELHSFVPPPLTFTTGTHHAKYARRNPPNTFLIHIVRHYFRSDNIFAWTVLNRLQAWFFPFPTILTFQICG